MTNIFVKFKSRRRNAPSRNHICPFLILGMNGLAPWIIQLATIISRITQRTSPALIVLHMRNKYKFPLTASSREITSYFIYFYQFKHISILPIEELTKQSEAITWKYLEQIFKTRKDETEGNFKETANSKLLLLWVNENDNTR